MSARTCGKCDYKGPCVVARGVEDTADCTIRWPDHGFDDEAAWQRVRAREHRTKARLYRAAAKDCDFYREIA